MTFALPLLVGALFANGLGADPCWTRAPAAELASRPSPLDSVVARLGDAKIKVCYNRPSARGRVVMGGLVPFGDRWRLGANEATTIEVPVAVRFGDLILKPGIYSLYAIPAFHRMGDRGEQLGEPLGYPDQPRSASERRRNRHREERLHGRARRDPDDASGAGRGRISGAGHRMGADAGAGERATGPIDQARRACRRRPGFQGTFNQGRYHETWSFHIRGEKHDSR